MNDKSLSNLDKLLLELVFQLEQDSHTKEHITEQIHLHTANVLEVKQQICGLQENIKQSDNDIFRLQKHSKYSKDNYSAWKPTFMVFNNHEAYLESQLQNCQATTVRDKKIYEEHVNQYKEILQEHQTQYTESIRAQEYYVKKAELDDLQNCILKSSEQLKWKEATLMDLLEPTPFLSCSDWALQIKNTENTMKDATFLIHRSSNLTKEACELQRKMKCFKQQFGKYPKDPNDTEIEENKNNWEKEKERKENIFEDKGYLSNEKQQQLNPLHLPSIPQKLVRPLQTFKLSMKKKETDGQEKENMNQLTVRSIHSSQVETMKNNIQKSNEFTGNTITNCVQDPSITSLQNQMPFRLQVPQRQAKEKKSLELTATETGNTSENTKAASESKDSAYASQIILDVPPVMQDVLKECYMTTEDDPIRREENSGIFSRTPESFLFPRTPEQSVFPTNLVTSTFARNAESTVNKEELSKTPTFELTNNIGCEGQTSKSPAFSFLMTSTPKSPQFNLFESSVFETTNYSDQQNDSYSDGNVNPASPQKEMGSLFGKLERDEFAFSFHPEPSPHTFGNGKDEFSFPFSFGQDQKSSQVSSFKSFPASSQSTMQFTFF
ncbi:protein SIX6OS1 isoform X3 [Rhinatrema bivittatum]|uniref:protein SIX6OS1 isoform X3 n=1 Tax=Rhinatrema bivittatum TaxID=194408 RepID=UPI001127F2E4|nr:protein SIX6OS1 isoform X3 [Rhinatrema bivittatum]